MHYKDIAIQTKVVSERASSHTVNPLGYNNKIVAWEETNDTKTTVRTVIVNVITN